MRHLKCKTWHSKLHMRHFISATGEEKEEIGERNYTI
jgi:hypothetical protein